MPKARIIHLATHGLMDIAVAFLYFILSLFWKAPAVYGIGAIALIALLIELAQLLNLTPQHQTLVTEIALGSSFDPWDLVAYPIGLAFAFIIEKYLYKF